MVTLGWLVRRRVRRHRRDGLRSRGCRDGLLARAGPARPGVAARTRSVEVLAGRRDSRGGPRGHRRSRHGHGLRAAAAQFRGAGGGPVDRRGCICRGIRTRRILDLPVGHVAHDSEACRPARGLHVADGAHEHGHVARSAVVADPLQSARHLERCVERSLSTSRSSSPVYSWRRSRCMCIATSAPSCVSGCLPIRGHPERAGARRVEAHASVS